MVEEAVVAEDVVGDEDAAIFITTAKAVVKIALVKPEAAIEPTETTIVPEAAIAKLGKTTVVKVVKPGVAIELIETTAPACHLC